MNNSTLGGISMIYYTIGWDYEVYESFDKDLVEYLLEHNVIRDYVSCGEAVTKEQALRIYKEYE